jgi:hypothetical protein
MAIIVTHSKVSTIPDDADTSLVRPSDWNADHTLVGLGTMAEQDANAVAITGGTATLTSVTTPTVKATNSAGLALKNSGGTTQISMGAGGGDNVTVAVSTNLNGTNAQIDISPTGTGHVHIKPTGVNSVEIAPTFIGEMDNITIGAITPAAGSFTNLSVTGTTSFDGSEGTSGQVLTSAGTGATPTWSDVVTPTGTQTLTNKRVTPRVGSNGATTSGNITPTGDTADQYNITGLTGTSAIQIPSGTPTDAQKLSIRIEDNGTGRTLSWVTTAGGYRVIGTTLPTTTTANKTIYVGCIYNSADSFWDVVAVASEV